MRAGSGAADNNPARQRGERDPQFCQGPKGGPPAGPGELRSPFLPPPKKTQPSTHHSIFPEKLQRLVRCCAIQAIGFVSARIVYFQGLSTRCSRDTGDRHLNQVLCLLSFLQTMNQLVQQGLETPNFMRSQVLVSTNMISASFFGAEASGGGEGVATLFVHLRS